ncbi:MAG: DNA mismatch repair protein MutS2 [Planctomycetota bacterium]|jgi:DNA mismatch repair protein MutS2
MPSSNTLIYFQNALPRDEFAWDVLEMDEVLSLLEPFCASSLGYRALRDLGPRPEPEALAALQHIREMRELMAQETVPSLSGLADPLPEDPMDLMAYDEQRYATLRGFLDAAGRLTGWFEDHQEHGPGLFLILSAMPDVKPLLSRIDQTVDERGRVRREASPLLQRLDMRTEELNGQVTVAMRGVLARAEVRAVLSDSAVHRRASRPVLAVRAKSSGRVRGIVHDRSQSGESVFIEPREVIEIGNQLAAARADRRREVERVLIELTRAIISRIDRVHEVASCLMEVELAWIGAGFCKAFGAHPAMQPGDKDTSQGLLLRSARHPLLIDQAMRGEIDQVVPIDLRLGDTFDMLIITGPNTGGKTLALKTAGLFALMTRTGLAVPGAEGTTVPMYAGIAADIGDEQEIRQNLSTFASHLVRIKTGLRRANPETLVLLDELGGGTDPDEGAALGEAVLETLLKRGAPTLVSTHIGRLKEFAFRHPRAENACTEFDLKTLAPLYHLLVGTPGESGALIIARRLGLPEQVVQLAQKRLVRRDTEITELMGDVRKARMQAEETRKIAEAELDSARQTERDLKERAEAIDRRSEQLELEAQRGLEERLRDGMRHLGRVQALLPQVPKDTANAMADILEALEAELSGASLTDRRQAFIQSLKKGSMVYLPRYRQRVMVHKVDKDKKKVICKLGSMKVHVAFDEVTPYESL